MRGSRADVENGSVALLPAPDDAAPEPAFERLALLTTVAEPKLLVVVVVVVPETVAGVDRASGANVGTGNDVIADVTAFEVAIVATGCGVIAVDGFDAPSVVVPAAFVVVAASVVEVPADVVVVPPAAVAPGVGDTDAVVDAALPVVAAVAFDASDAAPLEPPLDVEPETVDDVALPPPAPAPDVDAALVPAPPSASAWFVEPDVLPYLTVNAPDGDVAPCSTDVLLVNSVSAISAPVCTSPRTSSDVSRLPEYAMPPGDRALFAWIALTTSVGTNPRLESFIGSSVTSSAGVTDPFALTLDTPSTCSRSGMTSFVTIADSAAVLSDDDVTESVTIVACAGSNERVAGAGRSCGSARPSPIASDPGLP